MSDNWYFNGATQGGEFGFDALEDFTPEEKEEVKAYVEKFRAEAPEGFEYLGQDDNNPFGHWERKDDEFGGTHVSLLPATGKDSIADREYPAGLAMWVFAGEGMELGHLTPGWEAVDREIKETGDRWASWSDEELEDEA